MKGAPPIGDELSGIRELSREDAAAEFRRFVAPFGDAAPSTCGSTLLAPFLRRGACLAALACGAVQEMSVSAPKVVLDLAVARALATWVAGILDTVSAAVSGPILKVEVTVARKDRLLVLAVSIGGLEGRPVPGLTGSAALAGLVEAVAAMGGALSRGVEEGSMLFGMAVPVRDMTWSEARDGP